MPKSPSEQHPLELIHPRNIKYLVGELQVHIRNKLWAQILIGMVLGLAVGFLFGPTAGLVSRKTAETAANWLALPGHLFLTMIQMIVVPLVVASVVRGLAASSDLEQLKSVGMRLVVFFLGTTALAVAFGIAITLLIRPGSYIQMETTRAAEQAARDLTGQAPTDQLTLRNLPESIISVLPANPLSDLVETNMLQVVLFSIVIGIALVSLKPEQSKPMLELLGSLQSVCMTVVKWTMMIAPLAVFGLLAQLTAQTGLETLTGIGAYVATIVIGLVGVLVLFVLISWIVGGHHPWHFAKSVREAQLLAFSTDSSVAVMPLSVQTAEDKLGVRPSIAQIVIPIGATVNMAGTAMFQGSATIFLTQVYGLDFGVGMMAVLILTAVGSSIGTPATPGVGIIILSVVLKGVGVPLDGIALILGVDRILEMMRTSVNVTGDLSASVVMNRFAKSAHSPQDELAQEQSLEAARQERGEDVVTGPPEADAQQAA